MIMRKHTKTSYTLQAGDVLYHFDGKDIETITLTNAHVGETPKAIVGYALIKPNARVERKRNGQLVLWKASTCDYGMEVSRIKQNKSYMYRGCLTTLFVDEASCRSFMEHKFEQRAKLKAQRQANSVCKPICIRKSK